MRNFVKLDAAILIAAASAVLITGSAKADVWDQRTTITFSAPVEVPGVHQEGFEVLPAGSYVFQLMNSPSDRHIVQIFDRRQTRLIATVFAVPSSRGTIPDRTIITFRERPEGSPAAIKAWYYPGSSEGNEFTYPKQRESTPLVNTAENDRIHEFVASPVAQLRLGPPAPITPVESPTPKQLQFSDPDSTADEQPLSDATPQAQPGTPSNLPTSFGLPLFGGLFIAGSAWRTFKRNS